MKQSQNSDNYYYFNIVLININLMQFGNFLGKLLNTRRVRALINLTGKTKSDERVGQHWEDMG